MPKDEVNEIDPELHQMWLEARDRHLGHVSAYSFDVTAAPPGGGNTAPEAHTDFGHVCLGWGIIIGIGIIGLYFISVYFHLLLIN